MPCGSAQCSVESTELRQKTRWLVLVPGRSLRQRIVVATLRVASTTGLMYVLLVWPARSR
jgi:hypothetical protein